MSVSIGWKKKDPQKLSYIDGGSSFHEILKRAFGRFPFDLDEKDLDKLQGISVCNYDGANDLISAICEHKAIVVDADW